VWVVLGLLILVIENYRILGMGTIVDKMKSNYKQNNVTIFVDQFSLGEVPTTIITINNNLKKDEKAWLTNYLKDGSVSLDLTQYKIEYDYLTKEIKNYTLVKEIKDAIPMEPNVFIQGTKVELNAFFNPKFSRYGVNCKGCSGQNSGHGNFAVGIGADVNNGVRQFSGKYKKGITFEGYYIVASDRSIPLCTILEIDNHNFKGEGLEPGVPFYAVVLDRGGAIKNNRLDFYIGDERHYNDFVKYSGKRLPIATIIAFGKRSRDASGKRSCKLPKIEDLKENANN